MARLRIVELPMIHRGDTSETPFGVILDQADADSPIFSDVERSAQAFREWGARGVLITPETIDLADELPPAAGFVGDRLADVERMDAITDALGLDRLRDWDEITRAARIVRDGGHLFNEPGFLDPIRCARCGINPAKVHLNGDRRTCAEVLADGGRDGR